MADPRKRPRDSPQAAKVVEIASGQVEDRPPTPEEQGKDESENSRAPGRVSLLMVVSSCARGGAERCGESGPRFGPGGGRFSVLGNGRGGRARP